MYDEMSDRLMISSREENEVIEGSVRLLNIIFDLTIENRVANIELLNASDYLDSLDIDSSILTNLVGAEFVIKKAQYGYLISIVLRSPRAVARVPYNIHLPSEKEVILNVA